MVVNEKQKEALREAFNRTYINGYIWGRGDFRRYNAVFVKLELKSGRYDYLPAHKCIMDSEEGDIRNEVRDFNEEIDLLNKLYPNDEIVKAWLVEVIHSHDNYHSENKLETLF